MATRKVFIKNPDTALYAGLVLTAAGIVMLRQAYEARGRKRPWGFKLIGLAQ